MLTADSLKVRHTTLSQTLLHIEPFAGVAVPEESTWYVDSKVDDLVVVIAKAQIGKNKTEQHWGHSLATKDGLVECYMGAKEVRALKEERAKKEQLAETDRVARVKASQRQLRASEMEREAKEAKEAKRLERAQAWSEQAQADAAAAEAKEAEARRAHQRSDGGLFGAMHDVGYSWILWGVVLAALMVLAEVGVWPLMQPLLLGGAGGAGGASGRAGMPAAAAADPLEPKGEAWFDEAE